MTLLEENVIFGLPLQVEELFRNCCTVQQTQIEIEIRLNCTKVRLVNSRGCVVSFPVHL